MPAKCILAVLAIAVSLAATPTRAENAEQRAMAQRIARSLKTSGQLKDYRVGVKYEDGVAWLMGTVTSQQQREAALRITRQTDGIRHVVDKLEVTGTEETTVGDSDISNDFASNDFADSLQLASLEAKAATPPRRRPARSQPMRRTALGGSQRPVPAARIGGIRQASAQSRRPMPMVSARQGMARQGMARQGIARQGMATPVNFQTNGARAMPAANNVGYVPGGGVRGASYDQGHMPGYAWPTYASYPNYAALSYPRQYSPTAWPYIGPFYPYPQVPLGWRRVSLEWDDGWWFLDFNDTKMR